MLSPGLSQSRDGTQVCHIAGRTLYHLIHQRSINVLFQHICTMYTLCTITINNIENVLTQWRKMINKRQTRYIKESKRKKWHDEIETQVRWSGILTPHWVLIGECTSFPSCTIGFNLLYIF